MSGRSRQAKRPGSTLWLQGLACGALVTLATPTAVLAGLLLAPALMLWLVDRSPDRSIARPVLFCGVAATIRPLLALCEQGHTTAVSLALAADVATLGLAWAAQAAGWLASELTPLVAGLVLTARARARTARLQSERAKLTEEWGLPPAPGAAVDQR